MNRKKIIAFWIFLFLLIALVPASVGAQQTKSRSEIEFLPVETQAELPVRPWEPYNILYVVEMGGQFVDVDGSQTVFNSQQNYRDGLRVFDFTLRGKGNDDALFSRFSIEGGGWGNNEPYSWGKFNFTRDKLFDFSGKVRQSRYDWFFPGFARDQHFNQTERRMQKYDLTLFPKQRFRFNAGYSRNSSYGPSYTTFDFSRAEFPLIESIRQTHDQYTLGVEGNVNRWFINFDYGYRYFRNDRFLELVEAPTSANDPADAASFNQFNRLHPSTGEIPFYRFNIAGRPHDTVEVTARMVYSRAESNFTRTDFYDGTTYSQGPAVPSVTMLADFLAVGSSVRPMTSADVGLTWRPNNMFTLTHSSQYLGYDIAGFSDEDRDITCGAVSASCDDGLHDLFWNNFFDLDAIAHRTEARVDINPQFGVRGGFRYLTRDFRFNSLHTVVDNGIPGTPDTHSEEFDFTNTSYLAGANYKVNRRASLFFDMEVGDNTRVFTRIGPAQLDRYRVRGQFELADGVRVSGSWFLFDNQNDQVDIPNPVFVNGVDPLAPETLPSKFTSENRGFAVDFQYGQSGNGYVNVGYAANDLSTRTDVVYYAGGGFPAPLMAGESFYTLEDSYFYVDGGGHLGRGFYLDGGYRLVDTSAFLPPSDPIAVCAPFVSGVCDDTGALAPLEYFDGGLKYHQPHLSFRYAISDNVEWKGVWRYYKYDQLGGTLSDYNAHVIAGSVRLHF